MTSAATPFAVNGDSKMACSALLICGLLTVSAPDVTAAKGDLATYEQARDKAAPNADAQVKLALWCEAHALQAERLTHLARAVLIDPKNVTARGLLGLVAYQGYWKRPEVVAEKVKADADLTAKLAEYNARRAGISDHADSHMKLGLWCEENGLNAEAQAHFTNVTRLDPGRELAWKKLGCKRVGGRWITEAQLAAEKADSDAQKLADKNWKPLLLKYRSGLAGKNEKKRVEAETALAEVSDPRAVPSVWSILVAGSSHHEMAVQVLGQIDTATSSRALAYLAVFDRNAEIRRAATETLKRRDPREFAGMLVAMIRDPLKYEVKPVGGPGSPGAIYIAGKQANTQRVYAPPAMQLPVMLPGDRLEAAADGSPVLIRQRGYETSSFTSNSELLTLGQFARFNPTDPALATATANLRSTEAAQFGSIVRGSPLENFLAKRNPRAETRYLRADVSQATTRSTPMTSETRIPIGAIAAEYQKSAIFAQEQLARDTATLDREADEIKYSNDRIAQILSDITGTSPGSDRESADKWWVTLQGYAYTPPPTETVPTVYQYVPLEYFPQPQPILNYSYSSGPTSVTTSSSVTPVVRHSCFGAGTLVQTLAGKQRIESLRVGDRVLAQDTRTGSLGYQPVTLVFHNPPNRTFVIKYNEDIVVSTPIHRFWVVARGWVMAQDLKVGDTLRLVDGSARIDSIEDGSVQPVFNLQVPDCHDFFVGTTGALVHDASLPDTRLVPFDASPELASAAN